MATPIEMIKQLRETVGAGVLDCRMALEEAGWNYTQALDTLREKAAADAEKRADRQASQGMIELYSHGNGRIGVMVEVNTETDFAGRSEAFRSFAHELALHIAAANPLYLREEDIPGEVIAAETERVSQRSRAEGKPEKIIPRIVEGHLAKFKKDRVLLCQVYIRDDTLTIAQLLNQVIASVGENIVIRRFARWELGEGAVAEAD